MSVASHGYSKASCQILRRVLSWVWQMCFLVLAMMNFSCICRNDLTFNSSSSGHNQIWVFLDENNTLWCAPLNDMFFAIYTSLYAKMFNLIIYFQKTSKNGLTWSNLDSKWVELEGHARKRYNRGTQELLKPLDDVTQFLLYGRHAWFGAPKHPVFYRSKGRIEKNSTWPKNAGFKINRFGFKISFWSRICSPTCFRYKKNSPISQFLDP